MNVSELQNRFPSVVIDTEQTLPRVRFVQENAGVELFLQGAHISRFDSALGESVLFVSEQSGYQGGKAIRGGIPICFPWFGPRQGDASAPSHGFARTSPWQLQAAESELVLALEDDAHTLALWPYPFRAEYRVALDGNRLRISLDIHNTGVAAFTFEAALHTYFRVSDVRSISIEGLDGKTYLDQLEGRQPKVQQGAITFEGEIDRIYLNSPGPILLQDSEREVHIRNGGGWKSTVVWNPWIDKAKALKDLGDDEWTRFVCIESGVIADDADRIEPGSSYRLAIEIEVK